MRSEREHREDLVHFGKMLHDREFVAATDGNMSVRLDGAGSEGLILATPTAMSKGAMRAEDMVVVDLDGNRKSGARNVSSEIGMHLMIYRTRPDVRAVVHAHPVTATGFAAAGMALEQPLLSEAVCSLGAVPLARYATPGTPELAESLVPLVPDYDAILMANHGVVTYAEDIEKAYMKMETVEHFAKVMLVTHMLGRQRLLNAEEVEKLVKARAKYEGVSSMAKMPVKVRS